MTDRPFVPFAEVRRAGVPESHHDGVAVVADARGGIVRAWGNPGFVTFPRSTLKPVQALVFVESGAFDAFDLTDRHLALACASHRGEPFHAELVRRWLEALALDETALACGPDYPQAQEARDACLRAGCPKSRIWHNCSGKHCGFLTTARHLGLETAGYGDPHHPLQQRYFDRLSDLLGQEARDLPLGADDCTLPAPAMGMAAMAAAMARFAAAGAEGTPRARAMCRILAAMRAHPRYVAGTGMLSEALIEATDGAVIAKTGAEGYLAAMIPDRGLGVALKIADGSARARDAVLIAILQRLGIVDRGTAEALNRRLVPPLLTSVGAPIGEIRALL